MTPKYRTLPEALWRLYQHSGFAMAGAVAISRAISDRSLSDQMLETARESIKQWLGVDDVSLSRSVQ